MKVKEYWVYQDREVDEPWAIYIVARKHYRKIRADTVIYSDLIGNESKSLEIKDISIVSSSMWINEIDRILKAIGMPLDESDINQLKDSLEAVKRSFID